MAESGRFVVIPPSSLPQELRHALLAEFVTREGYDTADIDEGVSAWVQQLDERIRRGELLIVHDLNTEMSEVMTPEQLTAFQAQ